MDFLHDIGEEPFCLGNQAVFPHLVRDEGDEVRREDDLLVRRERLQAGDGDLEVANEASEDVLIESLGVLQHLHDLLLRTVKDHREAVRVLEVRDRVRGKGGDGDGPVLRSLSPACIDHELVCRVSLSTDVGNLRTRMTPTMRLGRERVSWGVRRAVLHRSQSLHVGRRGRGSGSATEGGKSVGPVERLPDAGEFSLKT